MASARNPEARLQVGPGDKFNFRCAYCYEDFAVGKMPRQVIDSAKELLRRRADALDNLYPRARPPRAQLPGGHDDQRLPARRALRQGRVGPWLRGLSDLDPATLACPLVGLAEE